MKRLGFALALVLLFAGTALADTLTISQAFGNGNYGTVTVAQNGANTINIKVDVSPNNFVQTGGPHWLLTFTSNVTGLTMSNFTNINTGTFFLTSGNFDPSGPFGVFNYAIDCTGCSNGQGGLGNPTWFSFDLTAPGLTPNNIVPNAAGVTFTTDIYRYPNGGTGLVGSTGSNPPPVPEPGSLALLGSGLLGLGGYLRRRIF